MASPPPVNVGDYSRIIQAVAERLTEIIFSGGTEIKAAAFFSAQATQVLWASLIGLFGALAVLSAARHGTWGLGRRVVAAIAPVFLIWPVPSSGPPEPLGWYLAQKALKTGVSVGGWLAHRLPATHQATWVKQTVWEEAFAETGANLRYDEYHRALQFFLLPRALVEAREIREAREAVQETGEKIREAYWRQVVQENQQSGFWGKFKAALRDTKENFSRGFKLWIGKIVGIPGVIYHAAAMLATGDLRHAGGVVGGLATWDPEWVLKKLLITVGIPAFIMLWAASFYLAILLWGLRAAYFSVFFPLKTLAYGLRGDIETTAGGVAGSLLSLVLTPPILALNCQLAMWGVRFYASAVPGVLLALVSLSGAATSGVSGLAVTPIMFQKLGWAAIGGAIGVGFPFAMANIMLPIVLEHALGGMTHHLAPRVHEAAGMA